MFLTATLMLSPVSALPQRPRKVTQRKIRRGVRQSVQVSNAAFKIQDKSEILQSVSPDKFIGFYEDEEEKESERRMHICCLQCDRKKNIFRCSRWHVWIFRWLLTLRLFHSRATNTSPAFVSATIPSKWHQTRTETRKHSHRIFISTSSGNKAQNARLNWIANSTFFSSALMGIVTDESVLQFRSDWLRSISFCTSSCQLSVRL